MFWVGFVLILLQMLWVLRFFQNSLAMFHNGVVLSYSIGYFQANNFRLLRMRKWEVL